MVWITCLNLLVRNQFLEIVVLLLRMPHKGMTVDGKSGSSRVFDKLLDFVEVHASVGSYTEVILHVVAGSQLVVVFIDKTVYNTDFVIVAGLYACSEFEIGVCGAVDIGLQRTVGIDNGVGLH